MRQLQPRTRIRQRQPQHPPSSSLLPQKTHDCRYAHDKSSSGVNKETLTAPSPNASTSAANAPPNSGNKRKPLNQPGADAAPPSPSTPREDDQKPTADPNTDPAKKQHHPSDVHAEQYSPTDAKTTADPNTHHYDSTPNAQDYPNNSTIRWPNTKTTSAPSASNPKPRLSTGKLNA